MGKCILNSHRFFQIPHWDCVCSEFTPLECLAPANPSFYPSDGGNVQLLDGLHCTSFKKIHWSFFFLKKGNEEARSRDVFDGGIGDGTQDFGHARKVLLQLATP